MKSIFFICKPLELLGAIEAKKQFRITECILIIKSDIKDNPTLNYLIEKSRGWDRIIRTKRKSSYGYSWAKLVKELQKESYEYLFTRAFPIANYFVNNLQYQKLFLLDDGNVTINIAKEFEEKGNLTNRFSLFKGKRKKGLKYDLIERIYSFLEITVEKPVTKVGFYTYYELPEIKNQTVIKNGFNWFRSLKVNSKPQEGNEVYIIGTDIAEAKVLPQKDYLITLQKIANYHRGKKLIYIPHGREQDYRIEEIKRTIGCEIRKNKFNVELDFMLRNEYPTYIVGTITTALITLKLIYKEDIKVSFFNFNDEKIIEDKRKAVNEIYEYQKKYIGFKELTY